MDIEKAKRASRLLARSGFLKKTLDETMTLWATSPVGTATITIPRTWLPAIIQMAKDGLGQVEDEIAKL